MSASTTLSWERSQCILYLRSKETSCIHHSQVFHIFTKNSVNRMYHLAMVHLNQAHFETTIQLQQYKYYHYIHYHILSYSLSSIFFINVYMVLFLFNNVIYVFLLLWLCILIVCLCMATLTEVFPCFFLSCKANARVKPAKMGHGPHTS